MSDITIESLQERQLFREHKVEYPMPIDVATESNNKFIVELYSVLNSSSKPITANQLARDYENMLGRIVSPTMFGVRTMDEVLELYPDRFRSCSDSDGLKYFYAGNSERSTEIQRHVRSQPLRLDSNGRGRIRRPSSFGSAFSREMTNADLKVRTPFDVPILHQSSIASRIKKPLYRLGPDAGPRCPDRCKLIAGKVHDNGTHFINRNGRWVVFPVLALQKLYESHFALPLMGQSLDEYECAEVMAENRFSIFWNVVYLDGEEKNGKTYPAIVVPCTCNENSEYIPSELSTIMEESEGSISQEQLHSNTIDHGLDQQNSATDMVYDRDLLLANRFNSQVLDITPEFQELVKSHPMLDRLRFQEIKPRSTSKRNQFNSTYSNNNGFKSQPYLAATRCSTSITPETTASSKSWCDDTSSIVVSKSIVPSSDFDDRESAYSTDVSSDTLIIHSPIKEVPRTPSPAMHIASQDDEKMLPHFSWLNEFFDLASITEKASQECTPMHLIANGYILMFRNHSENNCDTERFRTILEYARETPIDSTCIDPKTLQIGQMCLLKKPDGIGRVIILDKKSVDGTFTYAFCDLPVLGTAKQNKFFALPSRFKLQSIPCNLFVAQLCYGDHISLSLQQRLKDLPLIQVENKYFPKLIKAVISTNETSDIPYVDWDLKGGWRVSDMVLLESADDPPSDTESAGGLNIITSHIRNATLNKSSTTAMKASQDSVVAPEIDSAVQKIARAEKQTYFELLEAISTLYSQRPILFREGNFLGKAAKMWYACIIDFLTELCEDDGSRYTVNP